MKELGTSKEEVKDDFSQFERTSTPFGEGVIFRKNFKSNIVRLDKPLKVISFEDENVSFQIQQIEISKGGCKPISKIPDDTGQQQTDEYFINPKSRKNSKSISRD